MNTDFKIKVLEAEEDISALFDALWDQGFVCYLTSAQNDTIGIITAFGMEDGKPVLGINKNGMDLKTANPIHNALMFRRYKLTSHYVMVRLVTVS